LRNDVNWFSRLNYSSSLKTILAGIIIIIAGHLGAVAGAMLIGTAGVLLCYIAGIWNIVSGIKHVVKENTKPLP
jgi:TM2 domain-containing membrane protein YozV